MATWMWHMRRRIIYAVPRARGIIRLNIGPSSIRASETTRSSGSRAPRSSALPIALLRTDSTSRAPRFGANRRSWSASSALLPRMRSANGRTFRADMSAYLWVARYSIDSSLLRAGRGRRGRRLGLAAGVSLERPGRGKLAQLVSDHVLGHVHLEERLAVVHQERHPDEVRVNGAVARPRLDRVAVAAGLRLLDLGGDLRVDVRALL